MKTQGPRGPTHILYWQGGGSEGFLGVWNFGQKGFFWVYERRGDFLGGSRKKHRGFFWVLYFSSAQINNNNISAIYCWCAGTIFGYANYDVGIFWGIKHGLPSPPPHIPPLSLKYLSVAPAGQKDLQIFFPTYGIESCGKAQTIGSRVALTQNSASTLR